MNKKVHSIHHYHLCQWQKPGIHTDYHSISKTTVDDSNQIPIFSLDKAAPCIFLSVFLHDNIDLPRFGGTDYTVVKCRANYEIIGLDQKLVKICPVNGRVKNRLKNHWSWSRLGTAFHPARQCSSEGRLLQQLTGCVSPIGSSLSLYHFALTTLSRVWL